MVVLTAEMMVLIKVEGTAALMDFVRVGYSEEVVVDELEL